jgi:pyruvate/2-oxoglutarate dehydrogenase complex dihydrolipoamide acyltransferase (E2) component
VKMTIKMPKVADSVNQVTITEWAKGVGDLVTEGETLLHVETDKATVEVPSPVGGTVSALLVDVAADVVTGTPIAVVEDS